MDTRLVQNSLRLAGGNKGLARSSIVDHRQHGRRYWSVSYKLDELTANVVPILPTGICGSLQLLPRDLANLTPSTFPPYS